MKLSRNRFIITVLSIILAGIWMTGCERSKPEPQQHAVTPSPANQSIVITAIGDSITWGALAFGERAPSGGYPAILERRLQTEGYEAVVINKGISGEKAYQTRERFADAIAGADIALLMIGTNDIIRPEDCPEPHNCRTAEHIEAMVKQAGDTNVILLLSTVIPAAPPPCARSWANAPIQALNIEIVALAQKHQITLVDNHQALLEYGGEIFSDCLHLTDDGYAILADNWYQTLIKNQLLRNIQK
jgi:lysophospholipase L1-like esterase